MFIEDMRGRVSVIKGQKGTNHSPKAIPCIFFLSCSIRRLRIKISTSPQSNSSRAVVFTLSACD